MKTIWIVKELKSGKHHDYCFTREDARRSVGWAEYYKGFDYKKLVVVKGLVKEIK